VHRPSRGTCSQCIDRRLAALAAGLTDEEDPPGRYRTDLFTGELRDVVEQTMVERVIGTAREVGRIENPVQFVRRFGEASRLLPYFGGRAEEAAVRLLDLHRRHAGQVTGVLDAQLGGRLRAGGWDGLSPTCLLKVVAGRSAHSPAAGKSSVPRHAGKDLQAVFDPTKEDRMILRALLSAVGTSVQTEVAEASRVSRKTVGRRLRVMVRYGLVHYPHGAKKGTVLTEPGRAFAETLPVTEADRPPARFPISTH
jgi:hypothetical protein